MDSIEGCYCTPRRERAVRSTDIHVHLSLFDVSTSFFESEKSITAAYLQSPWTDKPSPLAFSSLPRN
jgi:hypothetical protein